MALQKPRKCFSYCVGCLGIMVTGAVFAIPVYMNALKEKFSYKQWIVELIPIICIFGYAFLIPAGLFCTKFGPSWTSFVGLIVTGTGYFMQWSTNFAVSFYIHAGLLPVLFHFFIGFGYGFLKMAIVMTCIEYFKPIHRAKAMGFISVMFSLGAVLSSYIYGLFVNGHIVDEENQDLEGYFLYSGVLVVSVGVLCMLFLRRFSVDNDEDTGLVDPGFSSMETDSSVEECSDVKDLTVWKLFKLPDFRMFMLGSILTASAQLSFLFNVNTFLKSFYWQEYTILFVIIISISQALSKFVSGFLSDLLIDRYPRTTILLVLDIFQTIALTLCIFLSDNWTMLLSTIIIVAMADGCLWTSCAVVLREFYGKTNFGRNYGVYTTLITVSAIGAQALFGWLYQLEIPDTTEINCYGKHCFTWQFVLESLFSLVSVLLLVGVHQRRKSKY